jgi:hypothetical protein
MVLMLVVGLPNICEGKGVCTESEEWALTADISIKGLLDSDDDNSDYFWAGARLQRLIIWAWRGCKKTTAKAAWRRPIPLHLKALLAWTGSSKD